MIPTHVHKTIDEIHNLAKMGKKYFWTGKIYFLDFCFMTWSIGSFPLQIETTSEVYFGDFGLHNSCLNKYHHNRTP